MDRLLDAFCVVDVLYTRFAQVLLVFLSGLASLRPLRAPFAWRYDRFLGRIHATLDTRHVDVVV